MQPKKHYFAHIPTIAIFIVFAMSAPLGVLLFILKSIDKNAEKEERAAAQAQADYRSDLGPAPAQTEITFCWRQSIITRRWIMLQNIRIPT